MLAVLFSFSGIHGVGGRPLAEPSHVQGWGVHNGWGSYNFPTVDADIIDVMIHLQTVHIPVAKTDVSVHCWLPHICLEGGIVCCHTVPYPLETGVGGPWDLLPKCVTSQ